MLRRGQRPVNTIVLSPSHVDVRNRSFQHSFGQHGQSFLNTLGRDDTTIEAFSVDGTGPFDGYAALGASLHDALVAIGRGRFALPDGAPAQPSAVFIDGTLDPVGGPAAVNYLLALPPESIAFDVVTAVYLQRPAQRGMPHGPVPAEYAEGSPLDGKLFLLSSPVGFITQEDLATAIGDHLAELEVPDYKTPRGGYPPTGPSQGTGPLGRGTLAPPLNDSNIAGTEPSVLSRPPPQPLRIARHHKKLS